jgi:hypothetical protein
MPFDGLDDQSEDPPVAQRGRPPKPKPDKAWMESELARLDRETAHYREVGSNLAGLTERLAEELRAAEGRDWRPDRPWPTWQQRGRGMLHASTYDPVKARHLALMMAKGDVAMFLMARSLGDDDLPNLEAQAAASCRLAAETCDTLEDARPLQAALSTAEKVLQAGDEPERLDWSPIARTQKLVFMATAAATGVSIDTLLVIYDQPGE